jgi:hypothetical protein
VDGLVDLLTVDLYSLGVDDAQAHLVTLDLDYGDGDSAVDDDAFVLLAGNDNLWPRLLSLVG